jgi:hypothetical protein
MTAFGAHPMEAIGNLSCKLRWAARSGMCYEINHIFNLG